MTAALEAARSWLLETAGNLADDGCRGGPLAEDRAAAALALDALDELKRFRQRERHVDELLRVLENENASAWDIGVAIDEVRDFDLKGVDE